VLFQFSFLLLWQAFRDATRKTHFILHAEMDLPISGAVWLQCVGFFKFLVGEEPTTDLRMQVPPPATNVVDGLLVTLIENQHKAADKLLHMAELTQGTWNTRWSFDATAREIGT
jgi:hypothetical protein